jgi:hypothetical protein
MILSEIKLRNIVREEINRLLNEELSIADEVKEVTNRIMNNFINGTFSFVYDFYNIGEYNIIGNSIEVERIDRKPNALCDTKNQTLTFEIPIFNGEIVKNTLEGCVQHEVEHLSQISMMGNTSKSYNAIYNKAIDIFNNSKDYYERALAQYIYCCSTIDQDAFVNELYALLMKSFSSKNSEAEVLIKSQAYKALSTIRDVKNEMTDALDRYNYTDAFKVFDKTPRWFVRLGINAEKRLQQKIKNVIFKSRADKIKNSASTNINLDAVL